MNSIILERNVLERLTRLREQTEIRDDSGEVYGVFSPVPKTQRRIQSPYSDEELDRIEAEPGGRSLAEILADLQART
jgi:hypothetical protein